VYKREGRNSRNWKELKAITTAMISDRKAQYYKKECEKLSMPGSDKIPYRSLKNLKDCEKPKEWHIRELAEENEKDDSLSERLADYFSSISQEFEELKRDMIPSTYDTEVKILTPSDVDDRLKKMKKPKTAISIDPPPDVISSVSPALSCLLAYIINGVRCGGDWPEIWKTVEDTVIPKKGMPDSFDQCRNISCSSIFSKLCETYLLESLQEEVPLSIQQFGGIKGSGTEHYLVDLVSDIADSLEDSSASVNLLSIDFRKAFNRLCHQSCLGALADKGASNQTLHMTAAFLEHRKMRVRVGGHLSSARPTPGGAPKAQSREASSSVQPLRGWNARTSVAD
jgi:hypothetical protein